VTAALDFEGFDVGSGVEGNKGGSGVVIKGSLFLLDNISSDASPSFESEVLLLVEPDILAGYDFAGEMRRRKSIGVCGRGCTAVSSGNSALSSSLGVSSNESGIRLPLGPMNCV